MLVFREKLLKAVAQLELRSRRNIASLLTGDYRSAFRGSGMQFKEFRNYEPGDDIRHMSWQVTARTRRPTVKVYEEERELNVLMMVDVSGSALLGNQGRRKMDMFAELTALVGLTAVKSGDPFGTLFFSDKVQRYLPLRRSQDHVRASLAQLLAQPYHGAQSDIRPAIAYAQKVLNVRSLVVIVSDFMMPNFRTELIALTRRHDVILLHGTAPLEWGEKLSGIYATWDPETGSYALIDGNSRASRQKLSGYQNHLADTLGKMARSCGADYLPLNVDNDYLQTLVTFFRGRSPRR